MVIPSSLQKCERKRKIVTELINPQIRLLKGMAIALNVIFCFLEFMEEKHISMPIPKES